MHLWRYVHFQFVIEHYSHVYIYMVNKEMQVCNVKEFTIKAYRFGSVSFFNRYQMQHHKVAAAAGQLLVC